MPSIRLPLLALALLAISTGCTRATVADRPPAPTNLPTAGATTSPPLPSSSPAGSTSSRPPTRPASPTRTAQLPVPVPPVSAQARAAGLIDVRTIVPDAIIDLRYATSSNFVGVQLYPSNARCLVHQSMAAGLRVAADRLRRGGNVLVFWDCYRPHAVQVHMFQIVPDSNWVARPGQYASSHESARSVDVSLAHAASTVSCAASQRVQSHCLLDMGTGFDDFTARAHAFASYGVSPAAQANRALLRTAMNAGGIVVYSGEWWHFDGPGALVERPILDVPVN